jgi:hypothetical protein
MSGACLLCREEENETRLLLKCTKTSWREEVLNKWPNTNDEIALWKLLTGNKATAETFRYPFI